jgi:SAM-dependent methyltransferase
MEEDWLAANRANWDDRVAIHVASDFYDVDGWLSSGARSVRPWELDVIGEVTDLDVVHLQCHFGLDTLALARAGARVTGVDFSAAALAQARDLATRAGLANRARFVEADVQEAAAALAPDTFDLVYVSLGALCWLPSVTRWAGQVRALLRPGGRLFIHDAHPLTLALTLEEVAVEYSYFEEAEAWVDDEDATYTDGDGRLEHTRSFAWNHSLGEIVGAVLAEGLQVDRLDEHDWTSFRRFPWLEREADQRWVTPPGHLRIPLSFTLVATLPAPPPEATRSARLQ